MHLHGSWVEISMIPIQCDTVELLVQRCMLQARIARRMAVMLRWMDGTSSMVGQRTFKKGR